VDGPLIQLAVQELMQLMQHCSIVDKKNQRLLLAAEVGMILH
jgi:hypothetical protein